MQLFSYQSSQLFSYQYAIASAVVVDMGQRTVEWLSTARPAKLSAKTVQGMQL